MKLRIQEAAALAGVSAKTLRHYDRIGLLRPGEISQAGYRLYGQAELARLREILLLRELDFSLREIAGLLEVPERDRVSALRRQRELLEGKRRRLDGIIALVDGLIEGEDTMNFKPFHKEEWRAAREAYAKETGERWGHTEAYRESRRREDMRSDADRERAGEEMDALLRRFAALREQSPDCPEAQELVRAWQAHLTKWYYDCTPEILAGLGEMYANDPRFAETMDRHGSGTAAFMAKAIAACCTAQ